LSRLTELISRVERKDPELAAELAAQVRTLTDRREFGLNFERHIPESIELPGRRVRRGDKVRFRPLRGTAGEVVDERLWIVSRLGKADGVRTAHLIEYSAGQEPASTTRAVDDLVVVAEFRDPIYPGLRSTGKVERGGDKPFHVVINAENYHTLEALQFTHEGKVDYIYIDPPYNTRDKDWKYNNDYVDSDDRYKHSKWLAFMERRLKLAKTLLNPERSALVVTIDENEYLRLGLLLKQTFPNARIQMVTSVVSSQASVREGSFSRCEEYLFFVMLGAAEVGRSEDDMLNEGLSATKSQLWFQFVRTGKDNLRESRKGMFFPFFVDQSTGRIVEVGDALPPDADKGTVVAPSGTAAIWPETADGREGRWRTGPEVARHRVQQGLLRLAKTGRREGGWSVMTVNAGTQARIESGEVVIDGRHPDGSAILREVSGTELRLPKTVWNKISHNAGWHGSKLLASLLPGRPFPYPKSLYAVEDALGLFLRDNPTALVIDFFAGSGTTAHAVMRLNKQDGGRRRSICVTNNEVSADEQAGLISRGLRPGDPEWEAIGICEYITKPRLAAAVTGTTPEGSAIKENYKFTDEFPMADGSMRT
jgi:adenine-specific DNA-methyltransferase